MKVRGVQGKNNKQQQMTIASRCRMQDAQD